MGVFSMCPNCGSDWCTGADCIKLPLERAKRVLADFYRAPLSMSSVQPILDLAVELNPELKENK